nr:MAG: imidazole glycerol phosphate synthase subunit HisH [Actinomycetota bacterium]
MAVGVVAYGLGNLGSVMNMLKRVGVEARLVSTPDEVAHCDRVLLPGVGAFDEGMRLLGERGLDDAVRDFAAAGRPLFGICLGMQLLLDRSEEGEASGLGLIAGESLRFDESSGLRVPHMGWNTISPTRADALTHGLDADSRFYFVHSYRVVPSHPDVTIATTSYGVDFASMIRKDNVMGAQFHPEKSHAFGMTILRNFASL